jgi:thiosulfate reductase cytochrome b subunit
MADLTTAAPVHMGRSVHARWVRIAHGLVTLSFILLAVTGALILMVHPRLYWGEVGNDLMPAWLELPISRNLRHGGWTAPMAFAADGSGPVTASRTFDIFNQNGWARSLHFLAGWVLVISGGVYLLRGLTTGHLRAHLLPRRGDLAPATIATDLRDHLRLRIPPASGGPRYGPLQKSAYTAVVCVLVPLMVITGLAMSPAVTASYPFVSGMFGGYQSARTIHFLSFVVLIGFLFVHLLMVVLSGLGRQLRWMTIGK